MSSNNTDKQTNEAKAAEETEIKKPAAKKTKSSSTKTTATKKTAAKKRDTEKTEAEKKTADKPAAAKTTSAKTTASKTAAKKTAKAAASDSEKPAKATAKKTTAKKTAAKSTTKAADDKPKKATAKKTTAAKKPKAKETEQAKPKEPLRVMIVAPEADPFIATGGLGQVAGALPKQLMSQYDDIDVRVVIPLYGEVEARFRSIIKYIGNSTVTLAWRSEYIGVFEATVHGVTYYFVDNKRYFDREKCYGYYDDAERFSYFSKAIFYVMEITGFYPDIIHANDWQTALVPVFLKTRFAGRYDHIRTVFTIHNMEYQGRYGLELLGDVFDLADDEMCYVEFDKDINLLKGAIQTCDQLTTVSPSYAQELQENLGCGMQTLIQENSYKLTGILNGIDTQAYDPFTDAALKANYSKDDLSNKAVNKQDVQAMFGMEEAEDTILIALVSRLVPHKGIDLLTYIMEDMLKLKLQFVLLGSGDHQYELLFSEMAGRYRDRLGVSISYNPVIARKIYAGADIVLVPSRSEPCGLTQMIACRYGTIPIVRATGGLKDSIQDCRAGEGNGFLFTEYSAHELLDTITQAMGLYYDHKEDWINLVKQAMSDDFSWKKSAEKYREVYGRIS